MLAGFLPYKNQQLNTYSNQYKSTNYVFQYFCRAKRDYRIGFGNIKLLKTEMTIYNIWKFLQLESDFKRIIQSINDRNSNSAFLQEGANTKLADTWHLYSAEIVRYFKKTRTKGSDEFFMKSKNATINKYAILQDNGEMPH